jgi:hypothetical protein
MNIHFSRPFSACGFSSSCIFLKSSNLSDPAAYAKGIVHTSGFVGQALASNDTLLLVLDHLQALRVKGPLEFRQVDAWS